MFRTHETRLGLDVLYTPGTAVSTRPRMLHDRRLPHHNGRVPVSPALPSDPESYADEASARISVSHPIPSLPLTGGRRTEQRPLGFPVSSAPSRYRPRTSRRGQV